MEIFNKFLSNKTYKMKKIFLIVSVTVIFFACEKEGERNAENLCPIIAANAVPQEVKDSFTVRYPETNVITWFNKDSVAFCAYFIASPHQEKLVQFANNGSFIKEEIEIHQDGQHEDSSGIGAKVNGGCECEIHKEGD